MTGQDGGSPSGGGKGGKGGKNPSKTKSDLNSYKKDNSVHPKKMAGSANLGDKVETPDSHPEKFTKLKGNQGFRNNTTKEIWQKSKTNHTGDTIGEFKVGRNGKAPTENNKITVTRSDNKVFKKD